MSSSQRHIQAALALLRKAGQRHDRYTLFSDCVEMCALSIANSVDAGGWELRETRYLDIAARYDRATLALFPAVLAEVAMALEDEPCDALGRIFTELEVHNSQRGQFFTPYPVCEAMARMALGDPEAARMLIAERGFITVLEPACGAGAMVIALAQALHAAGINYQRSLHVTAIDIDPRAVHMAYVQFALLHIPAELRIGNALSHEVSECWFTPAHVLGGWSARLAGTASPAARAAPSTSVHRTLFA